MPSQQRANSARRARRLAFSLVQARNLISGPWTQTPDECWSDLITGATHSTPKCVKRSARSRSSRQTWITSADACRSLSPVLVCTQPLGCVHVRHKNALVLWAHADLKDESSPLQPYAGTDRQACGIYHMKRLRLAHFSRGQQPAPSRNVASDAAHARRRRIATNPPRAPGRAPRRHDHLQRSTRVTPFPPILARVPSLRTRAPPA